MICSKENEKVRNILDQMLKEKRTAYDHINTLTEENRDLRKALM
jgi:hypothetical protein